MSNISVKSHFFDINYKSCKYTYYTSECILRRPDYVSDNRWYRYKDHVYCYRIDSNIYRIRSFTGASALTKEIADYIDDKAKNPWKSFIDYSLRL